MGIKQGMLSNLPLGLLLSLAVAAPARAQSDAAPSSQEAHPEGSGQDAQKKGSEQEKPKEEAASQDPDKPDVVRAVEEVIVTARRMEERLQDTPISITAFTPQDLEQRQIITTDQLDEVTPNLQFTSNTALAGNNSSSAIFIRGIGQTDPTSTVDPGVGLYVDDVYIGQSIGGTMEFRDIRSVQVLRGPQGTLFGRNSIGGAILVTTNDPAEEFGGYARAGYGADNLRYGLVALDVPFSPRFKSRFTLGLRKQDGYVTRVHGGEDLGDTNTYTGTAKLRWAPTNNFLANFQFDYTHSDENGNPFVFAASNEAATFQRVASADAGCPGVVFPVSGPVPLIDDDRCANDLQAAGPYMNNGTYPLESKLSNWGGALRMTLHPSDAFALKSITSYRSLQWEGIRDADNTPLTILHTDYDSDGHQFSQELQLQYSSTKLKGTVGAFYLTQKTTDIVYVQLNDPVPGVQGNSDNNIADNNSWAAFSQWTYDVVPKLSVTLGGRYTRDTKGSIPDQFNYANPSNKYLPVQKYESTFDDFTFSGTISSRWSKSVMTYFSYSEGFKGGGWNSHFNTCQVLDPCANGLTGPALAAARAAAAVFPLVHAFGPEQARTLEVGFKTDLATGRLRLNGAAFTTDYDDLQFTYRFGVAPYLANAGKASIDGFELEATWVPGAGWLINGGIGFLDSSIDELRAIAGTGVGVAVGNVLPFSPDFQANLGIGYRARIGSRFALSPRVDLIHQTKTFFDANNTVEIAQLDPFTVLNASVAFGRSDEKWRVTVGGSNLTDELYATGGNSSLTTGSGYAEIAYARPRQFWVNLQVGF
jgi:iron complex outermembrane receptor protein